MEIFLTILKFIPAVLGAVAAVVSWIVAFKAKKKAKTEQAKAEAELAMEQAAKVFITEAETLYGAFDAILKAKGESAGSLKKETVLAKLRTYAIEKGLTLDVDLWSMKIDEIVKFTKEVNAKQ